MHRIVIATLLSLSSLSACSSDEKTTTPQPAATSDAGASTSDAATGGSATWSSIHTQFTTRCTPCHVSSKSGGHNMGQADVAAAYADSQLASAACAGKSKGACAAVRVRNGSMPATGPLPEPERTNLANLIDQWVAAGEKP